MATMDMQNAVVLAESRRKMQAWRRQKNRLALFLSMATMVFGLFWLIWILIATVTKGFDGMSLALFTEMTPPPNTAGGGLANAIAGSGLLILWATIFGTPLGIMAGIYLAEYGRKSWLAEVIRFINDILLSVQVGAYPDRAFPAVITAIDPMIGKSRTVQVQATLTNREGLLKAGMYAGIRVTQQQRVAVLTVPETALTYTAYGDTVFLAQQGEKGMTVKRVSVTVGERNDGRVEIVNGLQEGDRVVTSGQLKLSDGMAAEPVAQDTLNAAQAGS